MKISFEIPDSKIEAIAKHISEDILKEKYSSKDLPDIIDDLKRIIPAACNSDEVLEGIMKVSMRSFVDCGD